MHSFLEICERAARAGGDVLLNWRGKFHVREKGPSDLVTEADLASQDAIRDVLLSVYPDHGFLGEEGGAAQGRKPSEYRWIVDPLDGTTNYVHGIPHFCVSIALEHRGTILCGTIFDPVAKECFTSQAGHGAYLNGAKIRTSHVADLRQALVAASFPSRISREDLQIRDFVEMLVAAQSVRRSGSSALNLSYVAAGRCDAYWSRRTHIWDVAAGILLVKEAHGIVTHISGLPFQADDPAFIAASTASLHSQILGLIQRVGSEI
jgi:myo-inositol-1(or 4)-monophosphatase